MATDRELAEMIAQLPEREQVAFYVLRFGKNLVPDRFPKSSSDVRKAWGLVLGELRVPLEVWPEAIAWWSMNEVGDRMATPRELKEAARHIVRQWETDPVRKPELENYRNAYLQQREARGELPAGTVPESLPDGLPELNPGRSAASEESYKRFRAGLAARKHARQAAERHTIPPEVAEEGA